MRGAEPGRPVLRAWRLPLLVLLLGGCALRIAPVTIREHLAYSIPEDVPPSRPSLGIGPFLDRRSSESRHEFRPPLRLRWWGLVRQGENRTGDRSFRDAIADGLRRDAAATLARSGAFSSVRTVGSWSDAEVDLLLTAAVEEFGGRQYQSSALTPFRIGWVQHRVDEPVGIVRVHYLLHDRNGLVWEERIETRQRGAGLTLTRTALDAMAVTNERLAHELCRHLEPPEQRELRRIRVEVLDGCGLGQRRASRLLADASEILEREARLELDPRLRLWTPPAGVVEVEALLEATRSVPPPPEGIVLALVALPYSSAAPFGAPRFGLARQLGQHAVVGCSPGGQVRPTTVVHEVAHLFGAVHVRERSSLMHPVAEFEARFFDLLNRRILRLTRERPFGSPLPPALAARIRALYREGRLAGVDPGELDLALSAIAGAAGP